ncbi:hypothetical protein [Burkholderia metallica]
MKIASATRFAIPCVAMLIGVLAALAALAAGCDTPDRRPARR